MATSFSGGRSLERITDSGQATGKLYHLRLREPVLRDHLWNKENVVF
jgi:hypothetical protein